MNPSQKQIPASILNPISEENVLKEPSNDPAHRTVLKYEENKLEINDPSELPNSQLQKDSGKAFTPNKEEDVAKESKSSNLQDPNLPKKTMESLDYSRKRANSEEKRRYLSKDSIENEDIVKNPWAFANPVEAFKEIEKSREKKKSSKFRDYKNLNRRFSQVNTPGEMRRTLKPYHTEMPKPQMGREELIAELKSQSNLFRGVSEKEEEEDPYKEEDNVGQKSSIE